MYFEEAVKRINSIDWENFGKNEQRDEEWHVTRYLNRLKELVGEYGRGAIHIHPAYCANVARYLGDTEELDISDYCTSVVLEKIRNAGLVRYVIEWYLQLARYAEQNESARKYVDIFDPLIDLLERGWKFYLGDGGINVPGTAYWPLHGWQNGDCL